MFSGFYPRHRVKVLCISCYRPRLKKHIGLTTLLKLGSEKSRVTRVRKSGVTKWRHPNELYKHLRINNCYCSQSNTSFFFSYPIELVIVLWELKFKPIITENIPTCQHWSAWYILLPSSLSICVSHAKPADPFNGMCHKDNCPTYIGCLRFISSIKVRESRKFNVILKTLFNSLFYSKMIYRVSKNVLYPKMQNFKNFYYNKDNRIWYFDLF